MLRTFAPAATRHRATQRLLVKYVDGRRAAADVVDGLAALMAQLRHDEASTLVHESMLAVRPVPSVLWDFACRQLPVLKAEAVRQMLDLVHDGGRLERRFVAHRALLADSVEGLLALLRDRDRFEWAPRLLNVAMRGQFGLRALPDE